MLFAGPLPLINNRSIVPSMNSAVFNGGGCSIDMTIKWLCMNLHFFRGLVSAMNIILGHYNLIIHLELMV